MTNPLHIVFLDFDDIQNPLLAAGQAKATHEVASRLVLRGHTVTVLCSRYPGYLDRKDHGIFYKHIGVGTGNIKINNLLYILLLPFSVFRIKADIILECFTAPISTLLSPLWTKIPVVALPTSFEAESHSQHYHLPFYLIERFGCRFYKYFLPYTKAYEEKMKARNKNIIAKIVPEGVGKEFFSIKAKKPEFILFLGRLDIHQKGIDLLLAAYASVKEKLHMPLVIAGKGTDTEKIKELIAKYSLHNTVSLVGPAYGEKKNELLAKAKYVVMPSRQEGFSLFSLETLASGVPLLAFDIPGFSWADENVVLKAHAFNTKSYADCMVLLMDTKRNEETRKKSREFAKQFSWDTVAENFESFFFFVQEKELLAKKRVAERKAYI
jgi:glycosyltransferase involved in cell wall biosynthesis